MKDHVKLLAYDEGSAGQETEAPFLLPPPPPALDSVLEFSRSLREVRNSFCPTGPGGGIDATCSPGESSGGGSGGGSPHDKIREAMSALGLEHSHLSDDDLHAMLSKAASGKGGGSGGKAKAGPSPEVKAHAEKLKEDLERSQDASKISDQEIEHRLSELGKLSAPDLKAAIEHSGMAKTSGSKTQMLGRVKSMLTATRRIIAETEV